MNEDLQLMIEQQLINALTERRKALKISAERLGAEVYPGVSNSRMKVQTLTQKQGNGKSRGLRVGEFIALAKALGVDPVRLLGRILDQHEDTRAPS